MNVYNQAEFEIRLEWGLRGVEELAPVSNVVIIVDVLSFSTTVDIAVSRAAQVYPYQWKDETAAEYAQSLSAILAYGRDGQTAYSLSPSSLVNLPLNTKLVLPSPNGSTLSLATGSTSTLAGCLRNAHAVAEYAATVGNSVAVIPAGERWADQTLRPAVEDLLGAGAIISHLTGTLSPESQSALAVFERAKSQLLPWLLESSSGKELIARGYEADIHLASELNVSKQVPILGNGAYQALEG
ncbi:MAG: 2-phosphosulfolactate phosphatase [Bacteroidota bacterium]